MVFKMGESMRSNIQESTLIRKLPPSYEHKLAHILDVMDRWEAMAARIPMKPDQLFHPDDEWEPKYDTAHMHGFRNSRDGPTRSVLRDWGSKNVTVQHLLQLLRLTNNQVCCEYIQSTVLRKPASQDSHVSEGQSGSSSSNNVSSQMSRRSTQAHAPPTHPHARPAQRHVPQTALPELVDSDYVHPYRPQLHSKPVETTSANHNSSCHVSISKSSNPSKQLTGMPTVKAESHADSTESPENVYQNGSVAGLSSANNQNGCVDTQLSNNGQNNPCHGETSDRPSVNGCTSSVSGRNSPYHPSNKSMTSVDGSVNQTDTALISHGLRRYNLPDSMSPSVCDATSLSSLPSLESDFSFEYHFERSQQTQPGTGDGRVLSNTRGDVDDSGDHVNVHGAETYSRIDGQNLSCTTDPQQTPGDCMTLPLCAKQLKEMSFAFLKEITNDFNEAKAVDGGNVIGEGGFGQVFLGIKSNGHKVAVKSLKESPQDAWKQLLAEIETLCSHRHTNLVSLLGYSVDGARKCLVYEYMENGSLEDRLACKYDTEALDVNQRINIIKGMVVGIQYLHSVNLIHRDIKSANILLDKDFTPKVGDFATARLLPDNANIFNSFVTSKIIGSPVYLAPEAYSGKIHPGLDVYSFGIVLLEVLTGLPVIDPGRKEHDILTYVQTYCSEDSDDDDDDDDDDGDDGTNNGIDNGQNNQARTIFDLVDDKAGDWKRELIELIYEISQKCVERSSKKRSKAKMSNIKMWLDAGKM